MKRNNKLIFSIFILTYSLICLEPYAQTFEKVINTNTDEVALDALEFENFGYIILSQKSKGDFDTHDYMIKVYKLNYDGDFEDSLYIWIDDDYKLKYTRYIFNYDSSKLLIVGNCQNRITLDYQLYLAYITIDLEFISDTIIGDTAKSDFMVDYLLNEFGNIVGTGFCDNSSDGNIVFIEFNLETFDFLRVAYFLSHISTSTIVELPQINAYHAQYVFTGEDIIQINRDDLSIDTIISNFPPNTDPFKPFDAVNIPGKLQYITSGKKTDNNNNYKRKIAFRKMDYSGEIILDTIYGVNDTNYYYTINTISVFDTNYFYLGGTHNFSQLPPFLYPEPRWIFVNKLKLNGEIIWQYFYKGELNYMPTKILSTQDGGALIISQKYDWNSSYPNQRDIHILKVDSTGYYSGMTNINEMTGKPQQILVYPNPAKDIVNIATGYYTNLQLNIFDEKGSIILIKNLVGSSHSVNISNLKPGLYLYRFHNKGGFSESGKLIVE